MNNILWVKYEWLLYYDQYTCIVSTDHFVSLDIMKIKKMILHAKW